LTFFDNIEMMVKRGDFKDFESLSCSMAGSNELTEALTSGLNSEQVRVQKVPCVGRCQHAPVAVVGQKAMQGIGLFRVRVPRDA
jgi:NADH:ubiquinone oxidoreductase subunit E